MHLSLVVELTLAFTAFAAPSPDLSASSTSTAPVPLSTICGDIVNSQDTIFAAKTAYDCLTSVPFNPAVAARFIQYYNDTLQFQSTSAYLKNPPASYQQPAVDLFKGLEQIQQDIAQGRFSNQYTFEATLQRLILSAHDAHISLVAGVLSAFTFASPYGIASVSSDGVQIPKVYIVDDLVDPPGDRDSWQASPIATINGYDVTDFLSHFAAWNAIGGLEPHADWNQLMSSPVLSVQNYYSIFEGYTTFYPGENVTFAFENGTALDPFPWLAIYNSPGDTGPLATGGDFYNFFVLGLFPDSYDPDAAETDLGSVPSSVPSDAATESAVPEASSTTVATPTAWPNLAYPQNPDIVQPDLGGSGFLTGYFLKDISTAVLSIPSFQAFDDAVVSFSDTISKFLRQSKKAGMKKILVDVQQNAGGDTLLAIDAFKQFFPSIDPFAGSRLRAHPAANILGNTFTTYYNTQSLNDSFFYELSTSDWVATNYINAETGRNFTSWDQFFGPQEHNGDYFTATQRYNLSSIIFDVVASGGIVVHGYNGSATPAQPYKAEDIVILSDGLCSSTCTLFMELMHHEAGVRTVTAGGRPSTGPMQAASGSRGAEFYSSDDLDADFEFAEEIDASAGALLPSRAEDIFLLNAGINLRDQIRKGQDIPLQFLYEAANCRIFYTPYTFNNLTKLWKYAADAIWTKPELCVQGSTGYASTGSAPNATTPPKAAESIKSNATNDVISTFQLNEGTGDLPPEFAGQEHDGVRVATASIGQLCGASAKGAGCGSQGLKCMEANVCGRTAHQCVLPCDSYHDPCGGNRCLITSTGFETFKGLKKSVGRGHCPITCGSRTGPDFANPTTPPLPPTFESRPGSSGRGGSRSRNSFKARGTIGNFIKAGMA